MNAPIYEYASAAKADAQPPGMFIAASLLATVALFLAVVGPGLSHHYAELTPYHSHVFLNGESEHTHNSIDSAHSHSESEDVVNVTSDTGSGAAGIHIALVSDQVELPLDLARSVQTPYDFSLAMTIPDPPDRPPITS